MRYSPKNIVYHELIGLKVKVLHSNTESYLGIEGTVVDETKNLIILETSRGEKKILKRGIVLLIELPNGKIVKVRGDRLVGRPEDRLKRILKKRW